ncbi:UPF0489 protein C5orf22 like protein [Dufourea novaeangliae]|uniref:UPF0489 protein C5orf22 like protein n=1 Tax=Dufourea novaeangliae TaxID=178035 RepID=A0A154PJU0_DUFNO|nr:UPF0489 protein C5orf22 like protein [Dufourea novaeangliae]
MYIGTTKGQYLFRYSIVSFTSTLFYKYYYFNYINVEEELHFVFRYEAVQLIYHEVTSAYRQSEIDWKIIHDAGCTRDDTDLPDHVTSRTDLDRLISGTFRSFLAALPSVPTIVTIARSSEDEYCPPEDVDQIQVGVLEELRQRLGDIDIRMAYQEEETF